MGTHCQMFTDPLGPVEIFFYWPEVNLGIFYWPAGASGSLLASSPDLITTVLNQYKMSSRFIFIFLSFMYHTKFVIFDQCIAGNTTEFLENFLEKARIFLEGKSCLVFDLLNTITLFFLSVFL